MDTQKIINLFKEFFESEYLQEIYENARTGNYFLIIDFKKLIKFNDELGHEILDDPEEMLKAASIAIGQFDLPKNVEKFQIHLNNLTLDSKRCIHKKRVKDLGKLIYFEGVIRSKATVKVTETVSKYECPACGNIIPVVQTDNKLKKPTKCGCGRKGTFKKIPVKGEAIDTQKMELEELPENISGTSQPQRLRAMLRSYLVRPSYETKFNPGAKVRIYGYLKKLEILLRNGAQSIESDYILECVYIENIEQQEIDLNIEPEEMALFKEISKRKDYMITLRNSLVPTIKGHKNIKEGILLQLAGGVRKQKHDGTVTRGDIHVLLIGDPGAGKSTLLNGVGFLLPQARKANGKGASGVGLTASAIRDDFIGWTFAAGTLVLAHKSMAIIDELDKMEDNDRSHMHEALEDQTVTVTKANVQAQLNCQCSVLAGANPKYSRFDHYQPIAAQIGLPPSLINRFDLIFPIKDTPDENKDKIIGIGIFDEINNNENSTNILTIPTLRKYLHLAKTYNPYHTQEAIDHCVNYYVNLRKSIKDNEAAAKSIPISPRQLTAVKRFSEAYAKLRLSDKVEVCDAKKATQLMDLWLRQVAFNEETQTIDIDKISGDVDSNMRSNVSILLNSIKKLEEEEGQLIKVENLVIKAVSKGVKEHLVKETLEYMKKKGEIFEPKKGFVKKL